MDPNFEFFIPENLAFVLYRQKAARENQHLYFALENISLLENTLRFADVDTWALNELAHYLNIKIRHNLEIQGL